MAGKGEWCKEVRTEAGVFEQWAGVHSSPYAAAREFVDNALSNKSNRTKPFVKVNIDLDASLPDGI
jgi:hypothetical protein